MPAYEYSCGECGEHFERRQKMSEPELNECPTCGGAVKRLISGGAGAITKGASAAVPSACGMGACGMGGCERAQMGCGGGCLN
jgi:putative FmdB family regulatory protein